MGFLRWGRTISAWLSKVWLEKTRTRAFGTQRAPSSKGGPQVREKRREPPVFRIIRRLGYETTEDFCKLEKLDQSISVYLFPAETVDGIARMHAEHATLLRDPPR